MMPRWLPGDTAYTACDTMCTHDPRALYHTRALCHTHGACPYWQVLESYTEKVATLYDVPWRLSGCYYPWNRTFEIGFDATYTP